MILRVVATRLTANGKVDSVYDAETEDGAVFLYLQLQKSPDVVKVVFRDDAGHDRKPIVEIGYAFAHAGNISNTKFKDEASRQIHGFLFQDKEKA